MKRTRRGVVGATMAVWTYWTTCVMTCVTTEAEMKDKGLESSSIPVDLKTGCGTKVSPHAIMRKGGGEYGRY